MTPVTVGSGLSWSAHRANRLGPFEYTGQTIVELIAFTSHTQSTGFGQASSSQFMWGQSFSLASADTVASVVVALSRTNTPTDDVEIAIQADSSGNPSGTDLAVATVDGALLSANVLKTFTVDFDSPVSLSASTTYWIVVRRSGTADSTNWFSVGSSGNTYASGSPKAYSNASSTWGSASTVMDINFALLGETTQTTLYGVFVDATNNHVEVWKSTDDGATWAEADSANHPQYFNGFPPIADAVQVGSVLHILHVGATSGFWVVTQFDLSTETWGRGTSTSTAPPTVLNVSGTYTAFLAVRSDGDYVVLHQTADVKIMGTNYRRVAYSRYEGSYWTSDIDVDALGSQAFHADARMIAMDAADRAYMSYSVTTATPSANDDLSIRTLTSANTLNGTNNVDLTIPGGAEYLVGHAAIIDDTTDQVILPYVESTGDLVLAYANVADLPSWSFSTITTTNDPEYTTSNPASIALDGTTVHVFWPDASTDDLWRDEGTTSGGFGTDTEFADAVTIQGVSVGKLTNGIGIFYSDNGVIKYDYHSLSAPPISVNLSDSGTLTATESFNIVTEQGPIPVNLSDTGTFTRVETFSATSTRTLTDSDTMTATETRSIAATLPMTDSDTFTATESFNVVTTTSISLSDTGTISATDTVSILATEAVSLTDSDTLTAVEDKLITGTIALTDTDTMVVSDVVSIDETETVTLSDVATFNTTETTQLSGTVTLSDTDVMTVTDTATVLTTKTVTLSDSDTLTSVEVVAATSTISGTDSDTVTATETFSLVSTVPFTESDTLTTTESVQPTATLPVTDTTTLSTGTELFSVLVTELVSLTDTDTLTIVDSVQVSGTVANTDTDTLTSTESLEPVSTIAATDSGVVSSVDTSLLTSSILPTDADTLTATELVNVSTTDYAVVSDTPTLTVIDTLAIVTITDVVLTDTDTMSVVDQIALSTARSLADSQVLTANEVFTDDTSIFVVLSDSDTLSESGVFATNTTVSFSDSDTLTGADTIDTGSTDTLSTSDVGSMNSTEVSAVSGTSTLQTTEALSGIGELVTMAQGALDDQDTLSALEAFTAVVTQAVTDSDALTAVETSITDAAMGVEDQDTVTVVEATSRAAAMGISESVGVSSVDTFELTASQQTLPLTDTATITTVEALVIETTVAFADTGQVSALETVVLAAALTWTDSGVLNETTDFLAYVPALVVDSIGGLARQTPTPTTPVLAVFSPDTPIIAYYSHSADPIVKTTTETETPLAVARVTDDIV